MVTNWNTEMFPMDLNTVTAMFPVGWNKEMFPVGWNTEMFPVGWNTKMFPIELEVGTQKSSLCLSNDSL